MSLYDSISQADYLAFSDSDNDTLSDIHCEFCGDGCNNDCNKVKCSKCKHLACVHYSRKVLLKTLGERLPRWLCNDCLTHYARICAQIKNRTY